MLLAVCGLPLLILFILMTLNLRAWHQRAAALEHENMGLQLTQLAHELTAESNGLGDRARELAASNAVAGLVADNPDTSADRLELADMSRRGIDALLVLTASHALRFSVTIDKGQLNEQPPDPGLMRVIDSLDAGGRAPQFIRFADDRWVVARAITARGSQSAILGWVVVTRAMSPAVIARLARSVSESLNMEPIPEPDPSLIPAAAAAGDSARPSESLSVTTHLSHDAATGYAVIRDAGGRPVRVFRLTRVAPAGVASSPSAAGGGAMPYLVAAVLALTGILVAVMLALRALFSAPAFRRRALQGPHRSGQRWHRHRRCHYLSSAVHQPGFPRPSGLYERRGTCVDAVRYFRRWRGVAGKRPGAACGRRIRTWR